jgi:hypothetical protein
MTKSPSGNGITVRPAQSLVAVPTQLLRGIYQTIPRFLFQAQYGELICRFIFTPYTMNVNEKPSKRGRTQCNVLVKYTTECREKTWIVSQQKDLTIKLFYITTHNTITHTHTPISLFTCGNGSHIRMLLKATFRFKMP